MRTTGRRKAYRLGPLRINRVGARFTSVTVDLGLWRGILWERRR